MAEFELKVNDSNLMYLKEEVAKILGSKVIGIANRDTVLMFPKGLTYEDVKRSIEVILQDVEIAIEKEHRKKK